MAKDQKDRDAKDKASKDKPAKDKPPKGERLPQGDDAVATALTVPDAPVATPVARPVAGPVATANGARLPVPADRTAGSGTHGVAGAAVAVASDVAQVVHGVLPQRAPAYLGGAALLVLGVVDLPALAGGVLVYEALRRWQPAR